MRHRLQIIVVLAAWFLATGAQWDIAQAIAWGRMFAGYSSAMPVGTALEKTFSGEMCPICRAVQKGKQAQERSTPKTPDAKIPGKVLDICPLAVTTRVTAPHSVPHVYARGENAVHGLDRMAPPVPPPRAAA